MDAEDILLIVYWALCTLLMFLPCIALFIAALCVATTAFEICFLVFLIVGFAGIDVGIWRLLFI